MLKKCECFSMAYPYSQSGETGQSHQNMLKKCISLFFEKNVQVFIYMDNYWEMKSANAAETNGCKVTGLCFKK